MQQFTRILITALVALVVSVPTAIAHVTAQPPDQPKDGFSTITFRVPNERPVPTTSVKVQFPDLASVSVMPVPGWTYKVTKRKLDEPIDLHGEEVAEVVDTIEWSGGEVKPGEFMEFPASLKLPAEGELEDLLFFPATQTYKGGEVVRWIEKPESADSDEELEHPSPKVTLVDTDGEAGGTAEDAADEDAGFATHEHIHDEIQPVKYVGWAALVISVIALILATRRRRD